ncbi:FAD/NAD(P)-binding domain-containing protein [Nemania abortiva]|nr:FAD/NAD(P)-binding domain-containing protein [Nemania abortiva]
MVSENARPHVLIAGAGLSGLALAQCLRKQGISFEIFDRDTDISTRQGWAIAVHTIIDDMLSSFCSDMPPLRESADHLLPLKLEPQICFYRDGQRVGVENTPETPCMRLNRLLFRQWLATKIPIQWGKRLRHVEEEGKRIIVHFEDGTNASGDILVGADGINSVVREHLLGRPNEEVLNAIQLSCIWGETTLSGEAFEHELSLAHSAYIYVPPESGYFIWVGLNNVNSDLSGNYYWCFSWEDDVGKPDHWLKHASAADKHAYVVKNSQWLEPKFREIYELTPLDGILPGMAVYRDAEISSLPSGRIVLIGDAAHPMTPFRGEGGVHAIRDALNISSVFGHIDPEDPTSIGIALKPFQREILKRGSAAVKLSRNATRNNQQAQNAIMTWGHVAKPLTEEKVLLENYKP